MKIDTTKMRNGFFKKSFSVGYHNVTYSWMQLMMVVLNCIRCLESVEEGAKSPSAQTIRDRLTLQGTWLAHFHECMWKIATYAVTRFQRLRWYISIDETHIPFFGNRKKLNKELVKKGIGSYVHGYRAKTPGATGSFCFLVISLCCNKIRIPIAIKMIKVGEHYKPWLKPQIQRVLKLAPRAVVLADRGFGKATWFFLMLEDLGAAYVVRVPLRKKTNKNKVRNEVHQYQYWMTDTKTKEKALLIIHVAKDKQQRKYFLASNIEKKTGKELLATYLERWDLENIFKDADRVELPTSSRNPMMRLFCIVASFFMFALWQFERLFQTFCGSLRRFVKQAISLLCEMLRCGINTLGVLVLHPP